jgi:signal transduction histidine kinase
MVETNRSRRWVMVALFLVFVASTGAAVVVMVSQRASAHSMTALSTALMKEIAARARAATVAYLDIGPRSLGVISRLRARGGEGVDDVLLEDHFRSLLAAHREIEMLNFGWSNGDFMMVKRMPDATYSTKWIRRRGDVAESSWVHDNPAWAAEEPYADRREKAAEAYDPRPRPWYRRAVERGVLSWIDPYLFYSDRMPGIACALPIDGADGRLLGVVGADVGIAELSRLLDAFEIGRTGTAAILTADGEVIADPAFLDGSFEIADRNAPARPNVVLRRLADAPESAMTAAFNELRRQVGAPESAPAAELGSWPSILDGEAKAFAFEHAGTRYVAGFESFPMSPELWIVGVLAPQDDFMGSLRRDQRITMVVTLSCLFLAIVLAAALVMRADALEIQLLRARTVEKQHLIDELEARSAEMERFAYTVSHDLKSPLITIRGYLGMLEKDLAAHDEERLRGDLKRIHGAAARMAQLLDEVLELSRIGRQVHDPKPVATGSLVREAAENVAGAIQQQGVEVVIEPGLPVVEGDRQRLIEVFQNLIENAVKFMGDQPAPRIDVGCRQDGAEAVFWVRDNGVGIDKPYRKKIFELFERLDAGVDGTGVGLALVQRIVKIHGGRIWVESEGAGHGSTFCFTLPGGAES